MRIAVTGGSGFVGRFIVSAARAAGHEVILLGRGGVPWRLGDVDLPRADALVHLAFDHVPGRYRGGEGDDPEGFRLRNLDGTRALFRAAAGMGRIVFLSSRAVYGAYPPGTVLREEMAPRPDTLYGEVKLGGEAALEALAPGLDVAVSLRATGVYGPGKWDGIIADFSAGRPVAPRAGTEVHGADLAAAVLLVLGQGAKGVFNVSDICVDRRDLLAAWAQVTGVAGPLPERDVRSVSEMATGRLRALGWAPGGWTRLRAMLADGP